jgi:transcriptional regulator with XRE-family HTH domain
LKPTRVIPSNPRTRPHRKFGLVLRRARQELGWNLQTVAKAVGMSISTVSKTEQGQRVELGLVLKLARLLRIDLNYFRDEDTHDA